MSKNANCYKSCDTCKSMFRVKPSHYDKKHSCSKECGIIRRSKKMTGEGNHQYGLVAEKNSSWKGGKRISNYGYVLIYSPEYSRESDNYAPEHRVIMEKYLGRRLGRYEVVHHKNHVKTDNRFENLELMTLAQHSRHHILLAPSPRCNDTGRFLSISKFIYNGHYENIV